MVYNVTMYPYLFHMRELPSYVVMICLGVIVALGMFYFVSGKAGVSARAYRFYMVALIVSIALGFVFARLFQMLYNYAETGSVGTGITFLGGLIGGVATFFVIAIAFGAKYRSELLTVVGCAMPCVAAGHCLGRIGCFLAGCCYGAETDGILGVRFVEKFAEDGSWIYGPPRVPTQLIEAFVLLCLCVVLMIFVLGLRKPRYAPVVYLYGYSVFRFLIEFVRDDPRGAFLLGLSPSQIICLVMFVAAVVLHVLLVKNSKKQNGTS